MTQAEQSCSKAMGCSFRALIFFLTATTFETFRFHLNQCNLIMFTQISVKDLTIISKFK